MTPHLLYLSGEDHHLRIPFMLALRRRGFRVTVAGTGNPESFAKAGLEFRSFRFDRFVNPLADLAAIRSIKSLLEDIRPDLVQTCDTKPNILVPLAARQLDGMRVVRLINGRGWTHASASPQALMLRPVYWALHRIAARSVVTDVFEINDDKHFFEQRGMSPEQRVVIPGWIDVHGFDQALSAAPPLARLREELAVTAAGVVMTVTRMTREKGIPTLLKAAELVHKERPGVRFLLVGPRESEGPSAVSLEEIERHALYVRAIGPRADVPALLRLADVFAFPTEYREGMPRVLMEAALAELPIVTTNVPGCAEVIRDGVTGLLVPVRSPQALAARIIDLLDDRPSALRMAMRAAATVRRELDLEAIADRHAALYRELIGGVVPRRGAAPAAARVDLPI